MSSSPWIRKPIAVVYQQETPNQHNSHHHALERHFGVWDLIGIGVGSTVGSGIFVYVYCPHKKTSSIETHTHTHVYSLTGQIAREYAGPATFLSFLISGAAACCSGLCYAELSARIPASGSTYVYAYVCLGEMAAVMAGACLTLEYGIAGAAVARSWGDKVVAWLLELGYEHAQWLESGTWNVPAAVISAASTALLWLGVNESKTVTNVFTALKMVIVAFMILVSAGLWRSSNMRPLAPYGAGGILRGATSSFFGYLGYDEICACAGEAKNPTTSLPKAVLGTLLIVTVAYVTAALTLTGMLEYTSISPTSGFPDAFAQRGVAWAAQIAAIGELVTLPVVVLVSLMAQPRLTLSMADDGLLPEIFAKLDRKGNLTGGTLVSGTLMTLIAGFVPFTYLDDLISAGILIAFTMTNSCLVLLRCDSSSPHLVEQHLVVYNTLCFVTSLLWSHEFTWVPWQLLWTWLSTLALAGSIVTLAWQCPESAHFGGSILPAQHRHSIEGQTQEAIFQTPWVPYLPCFGMAVNWYLIAQLEAYGLILLIVYLGLTVGVYLIGCAPHSLGHNYQWNRQYYYETVGGEHGSGFVRTLSLPPAQEREAHERDALLLKRTLST